jgi:hypothetical protein
VTADVDLNSLRRRVDEPGRFDPRVLPGAVHHIRPFGVRGVEARDEVFVGCFGVGQQVQGGVDEVVGELCDGADQAVEHGAAVGGSDVHTGLILNADDQGAGAQVRPVPRLRVALQVTGTHQRQLGVFKEDFRHVVERRPPRGHHTPHHPGLRSLKKAQRFDHNRPVRLIKRVVPLGDVERVVRDRDQRIVLTHQLQVQRGEENPGDRAGQQP